ncbi:MAG: HAD family hydrolase [Caldilineae bacterium]|nr:MAG: HAD family hydrolase [Caldilineae bacterium]
MARLDINGTMVDTDLVIFDKDGTLIDFEYYWGQRMRLCGQQLLARIRGDESLRRHLFASLGYDPDTGTTDPNGPLATATMTKIYTIATVVLYQHGFAWDQAEELVRDTFIACAGAAPTCDLLRELGQVRPLFERIVQAKARVAVITSDDHRTTSETMALIGVDSLVSALAAGDDGFAMKPAPDAFFYICERLDVPPARAIMVGDTVADLRMAQLAGAGTRVGVLSGVCKAEDLEPYADVIIPSIDAIRIL